MVGHEPTAQERDRYERVVAVLSIRGKLGPYGDSDPVGYEVTSHTQANRMTLCGSEVPQDRWRGRTAGSGMWQPTENLLSWSPSGDSAIPYG